MKERKCVYRILIKDFIYTLYEEVVIWRKKQEKLYDIKYDKEKSKWSLYGF